MLKSTIKTIAVSDPPKGHMSQNLSKRTVLGHFGHAQLGPRGCLLGTKTASNGTFDLGIVFRPIFLFFYEIHAPAGDQ